MVNGLFLNSLKPMLDIVNVGKIPFLSDWASNTFRTIVASIDKALYGIITVLYEILNQIVNISIFGSTDIQDFATRIYTFLGIIMVFKVTFSLISYLVNPDTITDSTNGIGNIAKNFVITLVLIIVTPYAFDFLYTAQNAIINDNLIPKLVLGTSGENVFKVQIDPDFCKDPDGKVQEVNVNSSDFMALVTLRPFYQINDEIGSSSNDTIDEYCEAQSVDELLVPGIYKATTNNSDGEEVYVVDYSGVLSTVAAVVVFLLLLTACMDIALRTIKLGFLEIIAPVPIISYVDPKSGKDGIFKKWLNEVWKTWLSLFIRLATIYFAIYVISLINNNIDAAMSNGLWITLFLLIGALMFAKQAPKLLEDIFGIQFDSLNLHPIKKVKEQAALGDKVVSAPGKIGAGVLGGAIAGYGAAAGYFGKTKDLRNARVELKNAKTNAAEMRSKMLANKAALENVQNIDMTNASDSMRNAQREAIRTRRNEYLKSFDEYQGANQQIKDAQINVDKAQAKYDKATTDDEGNRYFSAAHPVLSGISQAARGATGAFNDKNAGDLTKIITNGINAAKVAAKRKNDFDKFGYVDRLKDLNTDITGVRNESGTTSIVKDHLKKQRESLRDIESAIRAQEQRFGNLPAGMVQAKVDEKNNFTYNIAVENDPVWSDNPNYSRESIQREIDNWNEMRSAQRNIEKSNKEYEDLLAINEAKGK